MTDRRAREKLPGWLARAPALIVAHVGCGPSSGISFDAKADASSVDAGATFEVERAAPYPAALDAASTVLDATSPALDAAPVFIGAGCCDAGSLTRATDGGSGATDEPFAVVQVAGKPTVTIGDGDLWPSCWSDDDQLYAAWGDGKGFGDSFSEIGVARIEGDPRDGSLRGQNLATGADVGPLWGPGIARQFHRKPTGMVCVGSDVYLAVQDLARDFNEAPFATIVKSSDKGRTWHWDRASPMFTGHEFTTIFFLDRGRAILGDESYVYAYGMDNNWRDSYTDIVPDPVELFLARVAPSALQARDLWEWFAGLGEDGQPLWSSSSENRRPVLHDARRIYTKPSVSADTNQEAPNLSVISQGGVVYLPKADRYVYTSWTEFTYELYESVQPWGPFTLFSRSDFGRYPWSAQKAGGYAATIPSKFITDDETMYLQSNTFSGGVNFYGFSLRPLSIVAKPSAASRAGLSVRGDAVFRGGRTRQ